MSLLLAVPFVLTLISAICFSLIVHESGHWAAAKLSGVACPVFCVGFGKTIFKLTVLGTEFRWCLIPIGGFVIILGSEESDEDNLHVAQELLRDNPKLPRSICDASNWRNSKGRASNLLMILGGVLANFLSLPIGLALVYLMFGRPVLAEPLQVDLVWKGSPAHKASVMKGDRLILADGVPIESWSGLRNTLLFRDEVTLRLQRGDEVLDTVVPVKHPPIRQFRDFRNRFREVTSLGLAGPNEVVTNEPLDVAQAIRLSLSDYWTLLSDIPRILFGTFIGRSDTTTFRGPWGLHHPGLLIYGKTPISVHAFVYAWATLGVLELAFTLAPLALTRTSSTDGARALQTLIGHRPGLRSKPQTYHLKLSWALLICFVTTGGVGALGCIFGFDVLKILSLA